MTRRNQITDINMQHFHFFEEAVLILHDLAQAEICDVIVKQFQLG